MKLGTRQIALLERCKKKGYFSYTDVEIVYNISLTDIGKRRVQSIILGLSTRNLIKKIDTDRYEPCKWQLTDLGHEYLKQLRDEKNEK